MSSEFENNQAKGRPSVDGKAAFSGAQTRGTYESDAQALADLWDPKKRREREEAAAAAEAAAQEAAKREAVRAAQEKAAAERRAREQAVQDQPEKSAAASSEPRRRSISLPEVVEKRPVIDPGAIPDIMAEPEAPAFLDAPTFKVVTASREDDAFEQVDGSAETIAFDPESTADLPTVKLDDLEDADDEQGESAAPRSRSAKPSRRKLGQKQGASASRKSVASNRFATWKIVLAIIVFIAVVVGSLAVYASLSRWVLVDDAKDIKGSWHLSAEPVSVVISDTEIDLAGKATYTYTMDTQAKVITETLGNMEGSSRYRFSEDRNSIAVFDDNSTDWLGNAMVDLRWYVGCLFSSVFGGATPDLLGGESGVVMYRAGYDAPGVVTMTTEPAANTENKTDDAESKTPEEEPAKVEGASGDE